MKKFSTKILMTLPSLLLATHLFASPVSTSFFKANNTLIGVSLFKASDALNGKTACQQFFPKYKCCIPLYNNTVKDTNLKFTVLGSGKTVTVIPQAIGAFYQPNGQPCVPVLQKNGIQLVVVNLKTSTVLPTPPTAFPSQGLSCTANLCKAWK